MALTCALFPLYVDILFVFFRMQVLLSFLFLYINTIHTIFFTFSDNLGKIIRDI